MKNKYDFEPVDTLTKMLANTFLTVAKRQRLGNDVDDDVYSNAAQLWMALSNSCSKDKLKEIQKYINQSCNKVVINADKHKAELTKKSHKTAKQNYLRTVRAYQQDVKDAQNKLREYKKMNHFVMKAGDDK